MGKVCFLWHFGNSGANIEHTLVPLLIKIPGFRGKRNIPWDYRGMSYIPGGDEGIRTLDTLASIPHFQCGALDQLCDVSNLSYSADSSSTSSSSPADIASSSTNTFSNSASISRNCGSSSTSISKDSSLSDTTGVSLYD